jgi:hypothetical protein
MGGAAGLKAEDFKCYSDYVEAKVQELPDYLVILLPSDGGPQTLYMVQMDWLNDFWKSRKNLSV